MAEQPTTMFDPPAGDRPASQAYQPGTWLTEPDPGDQEADDAEPPPAAACCCIACWTRSAASRVAGPGRASPADFT